MSSHKWLMRGAAVVIGVILISYWVSRPTPGLTPANCERIFKGMTLKDVEAMLGPMHNKQLSRAEIPVHWFASWYNDETRVEICFTMEGTVQDGAWEYPRNQDTWIHHPIPQ
jgi:hypothetical protein